MKTQEINTNRWEKMDAGNFLLRREGWKVSYNPDIQASADMSSWGFINDFPVEELGCGYVSTIETALLIDGRFYILNGDWRENYEKLSSKEEALKFFRSKKRKFGSAWSTDD